MSSFLFTLVHIIQGWAIGIANKSSVVWVLVYEIPFISDVLNI